MGLQQSKGESLYEQVSYGNIEAIKALRREGAGLEWTDREGKTPLIVTCMSLELYNVAKTLIELGANVNAYHRGHNGGTPLHHAARRGLEQTVKLLLSNGANPLVMNDDYQTPLDIARANGYSNVVRAIEGHVCLFSGWLRELHGPGFLELLAPQLLSRRVWVVVLPCGSRKRWKPLRLELAIYTNAQDAQPRTIVPLWRANLEEPNFDQPDPVAMISHISRIPRRWRKRRNIKSSQEATRTRIKLVPVHDIEKHQLQQFSNACKGIRQTMRPSFPVPTAPAGAAQSPSYDEELDAAINASLQSSCHNRPPNITPCAKSVVDTPTSSAFSGNKQSSIIGADAGHTSNGSESKAKEAASSNGSVKPIKSNSSIPPLVQTIQENPSPVSPPSVALSNNISNSAQKENGDGTSSSCTICLDAPVEGACIPCGHMVGCMSCLNEIKSKEIGCPMCRSHIDQVIRIYTA